MSTFIRILMALVFCLTSVPYALSYEDDMLYYWLDDTTHEAQVRGFSSNYRNNIKYVDELVIPETVVSDGVEYTVTSVVSNTFEGNYNMPRRVVIPGTIRDLGMYTFESTKGLEEVEILPGDLKKIEQRVFLLSSLSSIKLPQTLEYIGENAFKSSNLTSIDLMRVQYIDFCAFFGCPFTSVTIPASVTYIGPCAFTVKSVVFQGAPYMDFDSFSDEETIFQMRRVQPPVITSALNRYRWCSEIRIPETAEPFYRINSIIGERQTPEVDPWERVKFSTYKNKYPLEITGEGAIADDSDVLVTGDNVLGKSKYLCFLPSHGYRLNTNMIGSMPEWFWNIDYPLSSQNRYSVTFNKDSNAAASCDYSSVTIKDTESHTTTHYYPTGSVATIDLTPGDGYRIVSVSYNGEDCTDSLVGNALTTDAIVGDNYIEVVSSPVI